MKIKEIIKECEALSVEHAESYTKKNKSFFIERRLTRSMYEKLFGLPQFLGEQPLGVLIVGDFDGIHTFQEDGTYYVANVNHNHFRVEGMQECSKVLYDELMKLKMTR